MRKTTVRVNDQSPANGTVILAPKRTAGSNRANDCGPAAVLPIHPGRAFKPSSSSSTGPLPGSIQAFGRDPILAEAAHDLNNALNVVRLYLDLLAHDLQTHDLQTHDLLALDCGIADTVRQRLRQIQPAVQHAAEITREFMNPGERNPVRAGARLPQTALNPVLQRMVPILSAMLPPSVALHLRLVPDLGVVALDPVEVVRIVSNLVLNSCAALARNTNAGGGQVTIETARGRIPGWVILRVRDTGSGMSAITQTNLFRPFFTTKPRREIAGLGLASVLRMVRRAGGTIQVESAPGEGTDVVILFPCASSRNKKLNKKKPQPSRPAQPMAVSARDSTARSGPQRSSR